MNIAYISPYFWPERIGSAPYCTDVCDWLSAKGHSVNVIASRPHYPSPDEFREWYDTALDVESFHGARVFRVPTSGRGSGGFKDRLKNDLYFFFSVLRLVVSRDFKKTQAIVAYVPSCLTLFGAALLAWRCKAPVIGIVHDIESGLAKALGLAKNGIVLLLMRHIERLAFNRADKLIVLTDGMAAELRSLGCRAPISVLPIWSCEFPYVPAADDPLPIVAYGGNFGKKQHLKQIIPLITTLQERLPNVRVLLRGNGSERAMIERQVADLGLINVEFGPLVPPDELARTLQAASVHLVPQATNVSTYALPSKVVSIMAAGRPFVCIAELNSPLDDIATKSGAGLCVKPHDEQALFGAVQSLIGDPALCRTMGERGRKFVLEQMSRETVLSAYERTITEAHD